MALPTQWTWVRVNCGSWWWTGRPVMLQSMGSQSRTRLNDGNELTWTELWFFQYQLLMYKLRLIFPRWQQMCFASSSNSTSMSLAFKHLGMTIATFQVLALHLSRPALPRPPFPLSTLGIENGIIRRKCFNKLGTTRNVYGAGIHHGCF